MQARVQDDIDAAWAKLVSRAIRVALARQDVSYGQLAARLNEMGLTESSRSVEGKVQRGTFRCTFFLQALLASHVDCPPAWARILVTPGTWEERARDLLLESLSQQPWLNWQHLAQRLAEIGIEIEPDVLGAQAAEGTFSATLFLQCAAVCRFDGVKQFLDLSSLNSVALMTTSTTR